VDRQREVGAHSMSVKTSRSSVCVCVCVWGERQSESALYWYWFPDWELVIRRGVSIKKKNTPQQTSRTPKDIFGFFPRRLVVPTRLATQARNKRERETKEKQRKKEEERKRERERERESRIKILETSVRFTSWPGRRPTCCLAQQGPRG
jgi:hypothetical protein